MIIRRLTKDDGNLGDGQFLNHRDSEQGSQSNMTFSLSVPDKESLYSVQGARKQQCRTACKTTVNATDDMLSLSKSIFCIHV